MSTANDPAQALVDLLAQLAGGAPVPLARVTADLDADALRMLRDHGVRIDDGIARIPGGLDTLDATRIRDELAARGCHPARLDLHWSIGSTNTALLERARGEPIDRHVVLADHQSAGRGRRGRTWLSPVASNLYISIGARFPRIEDTAALSLCTGVALAEALGELGVDGIRIKWPNDLQIDGRKLSGILIESSGFAGAAGITLVIGMGVNVRVPAYVGEQIDQPWIDLATACPKLPPRSVVCARIVSAVFAMLDSLGRGERAAWLDRFARFDATRDRAVVLRMPDREVHGVARGIDDAGELRVEVDGVTRVFTAGEVSLRAI